MARAIERSRLLLGPVMLGIGCGVAAQPSSDAAREALARDTQRYAHCIREGDVECFDALVPWELLEHITGRSQTVEARASLSARGVAYPSRRDMELNIVGQMRGSVRMMDAAAPGEPFAAGPRLLSIVPYRIQRMERGGIFYEQTSYMLGVSEDAGLTWQFINGSSRPPDQLAFLVPGSLEMQVPATSERIVVAPPRERSKYLRTTDAIFSFVEGAALYDLTLEIREELTADIEILVAFDDPAVPLRTHLARTRVVPGQESLEIRSPLLSGFERGQIYDVWIYGSDPVTAEDLFEHRQSMLFVPTNEQFEAMTREAAP